jgi:hypothetical protein
MQPVPTLASAPSHPVSCRPILGRASLLKGLILIPLVLGACRDPKVATYSVPKESLAELPVTAPAHSSAAPATAQPQMPTDSTHSGVVGAPSSGTSMPPGAAVQTAAGAALAWTAPSTWQPKAASSMRKGTYTIVGDGGATAELAISAFPGDVGGEVANVVRWRGQVGLAPVGDAEATASITRIEANGLKIGVVDVADTAPDATRLLGAMVPYGGATWFFKLIGPSATVGQAKPAFLEFLKTVKPSGVPTP